MKVTEKYRIIADKLKAIAHPVRLCIVKGLIGESCNVMGMQDCLHIPQSTISQHLGRLKASGIIKGERLGTEIIYKVVDEDIKRVIDGLKL